MKRLLFLLLIMCPLPVLAQDAADVYFFQANTLCTFKIAVAGGTSEAPLTATLRLGDAVEQQAVIDPGQSVELRLPLSNQWYVLTVAFSEADRDRYTLDTGLDCPPAPPAPTDDPYDAIEAAMFERMGWGEYDIQLFREVYTGLYGQQAARDYIIGQASAYALIDAYMAGKDPAAAMITPEPTPQATEEPG